MRKAKQSYLNCNDSRDWCVNALNGKCTVLTETYPAGKECPFYKDITDARLDMPMRLTDTRAVKKNKKND